MTIVPLNDKIVVERLEADDKTAGGIILPDTAKEKPKQGKVLSAGRGQAARQRQAAAVPGEGRRQGAVHQLRRQRGQRGRQGVPGHDRGRHPGGGGLTPSRLSIAGRALTVRPVVFSENDHFSKIHPLRD